MADEISVVSNRNDKDEENNTSHSLDGGYGWFVVFGCFMLALLGKGFLYSIGQFHQEFSLYYQKSEVATSGVASLLVGSNFIIGPVASGLTVVLGSRISCMIGALLAVSGMLSSVILSELGLFIHYLTLGLMTGAGLGIIHIAQVVIVSYWFSKRLALATGVALCGAGLGISIFALLSGWQIVTFGWRGALLILSGVLLTGVCFAALFRKPPNKKLPKEEKLSFTQVLVKLIKESFNFRILKNSMFIYYLAIQFLIGFVFFINNIWMTTRIIKSSVTDKWGASILMAYYGLANAFGRIMFGILGNFLCVSRLFIFSLVIIGLGVTVTLIPFADSYRTTLIYLLFLGVFQGGYICLYSLIIIDLFGLDKLANVMGILSFFRSLAFILGPPIISLTVKEDKKGNEGYDLGAYISGVVQVICGVLLLFTPYFQNETTENKTENKDL